MNGAAARTALRARALRKEVQTADGLLRILDGVDLDVDHGTSLAILGPSGSGKSTLLALLAGLDLPSAGSVRLFDSELTALDEDGRARLRARHLAFVFQSFQLLPHLSVLENVLLALELRAPVDATVRREERAQRMLERVGLGGRLRHYPATLSGGEQQRVALARAFVATPDILLADEPTGSLDARTGDAVADLLFSLQAESGSTLVLVTHETRLAERCARRIELEAGRVVSAH